MKNIVEAIMSSSFEGFGIRHLTDDEDYQVGDICRASYDWDWEEDCSTYETTGEQLDGTCAYNIGIESWDDEGDIEEKLDKAINESSIYYGDIVAVLGCNSYEGGNDANEIIMEDARVLAIINLKEV